MTKSWAPEIEKKYKLASQTQATELIQQAIAIGLSEEYSMLQKDWSPDFRGFKMKQKGVVLRVRKMEYSSGSGPEWLITLKIKSEREGVHHNSELEMDSTDATNETEIIAFMNKEFGVTIDLEKLVNQGESYAKTIGLTERRMYMEKRRRHYRDSDHQIALAIDELPSPAGWFAEIELDKASEFPKWEESLNLAESLVDKRDYGQIVKDISGEERKLAFT